MSKQKELLPMEWSHTFFSSQTLYFVDLQEFLLQEGSWLNDNIISFYQLYLENDKYSKKPYYAFLSPSVSFMLEMCKYEDCIQQLADLRLPEKEIIFLPVTDSTDISMKNDFGPRGSHWSLLMYSKANNRFYYFDSLKQFNLPAAMRLAKSLAPILFESLRINGGEVDFETFECPQQENSFDCGLFTIAFIEELARTFEENGNKVDMKSLFQNVNQSRVSKMRKEIYNLIISQYKKDIADGKIDVCL